MRPLGCLPPAREKARLSALLAKPTVEAARGLLGCVLVRRLRGRTLAVRIVETEAYLGQEDAAAHAAAGRTARTEPLWDEPGTLYVYRIYGVHHCLNLAVDRPGLPGCVLVRAAEPLAGCGLEVGQCRGPGRLCRALAIDARLSGRHLFEDGAPITLREGEPPSRIAASPRVGIRRAAGRLLRFYDIGSRAVSSPRLGVVSARPLQPRTGAPPVARVAKRGSR